MLKQFNFRNYLSYGDDDGQTVKLSMMAGKTKIHPVHLHENGKEKLLSSAVVFGANGSGKSNLVKAIRFMKKCVLDRMPDGFYSSFNRNHKENAEKPSYFEVELVLDKKNYIYGFEAVLSHGDFCSEWLLNRDSNTGKELVMFERDMLSGTYQSEIKDKKLQNRLNLYLSDIRLSKSSLFLKSMDGKDEFFKDFPGADPLMRVLHWFREDLKIITPDLKATEYSKLTSKQHIHEFESILSGFGTGIQSIKKNPFSFDELVDRLDPKTRDLLLFTLSKNKQEYGKKSQISIQLDFGGDLYFIEQSKDRFETFQLAFTHKGADPDMQFSLRDESDGTKRLIHLTDVLLDNEDKVFFIDELDRCLHPNLTRRFLSVFLRKAQNRNSQLICTTHTTCLLDFDVIRRDEIWFVDTDSCGNSHLYSLEDYNERFDRVIEKAYLSGRYGAIPTFKKLFLEGEQSSNEREAG